MLQVDSGPYGLHQHDILVFRNLAEFTVLGSIHRCRFLAKNVPLVVESRADVFVVERMGG